MSDWHTLESCPLQSLADLLDVLGYGGCIRTHTGVVLLALWTAAVQILRTNADSLDPLLQLRAPVLRGLLERNDLVIDGSLAGRRPQAEEKVGLGVNGSLHSFDRSIVGAALDTSV